MLLIKLKEDRVKSNYDYVLKTIEELDELLKVIYKPIIGIYTIGLNLTNFTDIKSLLINKSRYNHLELHLIVQESMYKKISLAMPDIVQTEQRSILDYLKEGISNRSLLIDNKVVYSIYSSIGKSYEEVDELLDMLIDKFGPYMQISLKDLSRHLVLNTVVYPRTVLIQYINLSRWRRSKLEKCLSDINQSIVIASMVKQVKKLHEQKIKYLNTGIGTKFIKELNTRNLNLMYYTLVVSKPYHLNDIKILLDVYERGLCINDILC